MSAESHYRITAVCLMVCCGVIGGYHRWRAAKVGGGVSHKHEPLAILVTVKLGGLLGVLVLLAYLIRPDSVQWARVPSLPAAVRWAGAAICLADMVFLYFVYRALG